MSRKPKQNHQENAMVRSLDMLSQYDEYTSEVLPLLRKAISEGWTSEQLQGHPRIKAALTARQLSIALKDTNTAAALSAIRDLRDRQDGKATEKKELKLSLENASDEALNEKLKALLGEESDEEQTSIQ